MKTQQIVLSSLDPSNNLNDFTQQKFQLIFVTASSYFLQDEKKWKDFYKLHFSDSVVVGCSTAGEVSGDQVLDQKIVLTGVSFDSISFNIFSKKIDRMESSYEVGASLSGQVSKQAKAVMVYSTGLQLNGSDLVAGLSSQLSKTIPITGGLAGDGADFKTTYTLYNEKLFSNSVILIEFIGPKLIYKHGSFGGWLPFGINRQVTRANANILYELDGQRALDIYKKFLGDEAKNLPSSGLLFPFSVLDSELNETGIIRTILGIDEESGSLILAGNVEQGGYLKLMHASTDKLVTGSEKAAQQITLGEEQRQQGGLALVVSCIGRKLVMGGRVDEELEAVKDHMPTGTILFGYYSYGEICPVQQKNVTKLLNQTMTITYINEAA